jgi:cytochrome c-type biogenesis protein CcmF
LLSFVGTGLISLSVIIILFAKFSLIIGILKQKNSWLRWGKLALVISTTVLVVSVLILILAFLNNKFDLRYVALNSNEALPIQYKFTAIWAGQEGSLLLWSSIQVLFTYLVARKIKQDKNHLTIIASVFLGVISVFFLLLTLIFSNPFVKSGIELVDGLGMNPLLRHPAMVFHPPFLYIGFVGLSIPFSFAIAALITNEVNSWIKKIRNWLLISWLTLGIGIILGSKWAYGVLGWGGYWGWDAVENAGLMPWLTSTALLHGLALQNRRKGFKVWNISLAVLSFGLVLLGTYITRSGFIQSVHAFSRSPIGFYFLIMIGLVLLGSLLLMIIFRKNFGELNYPERVLSMEGMSFFTLILLVLITLSILSGTLLPTLTNGRFSAPPAWFNRVVGPQLGALVFLMGVCPLFGFYGKQFKSSIWKGVFPFISLILAILMAFLLGYTKASAIIGFALSGFAGGTAVGEVVVTIQTRFKASKNEAKLSSLPSTGEGGFGGKLVHFGIVMIAIGVIGTQMFAQNENISLSANEEVEIGDYTLVFKHFDQEFVKDRLESRVSLAVFEGTSYKTTLIPKLVYYDDYDQTIAEPAIMTRVFEDLYIVLFQWDSSGVANLSVRINPLNSFLWAGSLVLILGGWLSSQPRYLFKDSKLTKKQRNIQIFRLTLIFIIFLLLVFILWEENINLKGASVRPQLGQQPPNFDAYTLQNEFVNLADYKGHVIIIHFWATWCPQCEDELMMFEKVWQETKDSGVVIIGVAMNDSESTVKAFTENLGISFDMIADPDAAISKLFGVTAVPETFIINSEGNVENIYIGVIDATTLLKELQLLRN